jgi:hypothetical protein
MQFKQASSLWDGMVVHFINNVSVNLIHVVLADGVETAPTMRIAIAQTIMFIAVVVRYFRWKAIDRDTMSRLTSPLMVPQETKQTP